MAKDKSVAAERPRHDDGPVGGMNTGVAVIGFLFSFLAGGAVMWGYDSHGGKMAGGITADSSQAPGAWSDAEAAIPITSNDPMWGSRTAPVTIVEFSDFQCPFCGRVEPTIQQLKDQYGKDKIRIVWKDAPLPFHEKAKPAAEAGVGVFTLAGNDAFWKFHDTAFKNQGALSDESYKTWAKEAGVTDMNKFQAGLTAHTWADKVDKSNAAGKAAGVNGTPAFFINGVSLSGAQPVDKFKAVIDQELQKAQAKIASGTPKDKIYVVMSPGEQEERSGRQGRRRRQEAEGRRQDGVQSSGRHLSGRRQGRRARSPSSSSPTSSAPTASASRTTLKQINDTYGDKVRLVWKNEPLPFHNRAEPSAEARDGRQGREG